MDDTNEALDINTMQGCGVKEGNDNNMNVVSNNDMATTITAV